MIPDETVLDTEPPAEHEQSDYDQLDFSSLSPDFSVEEFTDAGVS
jgi:hypothetical protein